MAVPKAAAWDAVTTAQERAEERLGQKKKGRKGRFLIGLLLGGLIAYFFFDEQRRDDLLDRLTGASGPIEPVTSYTQQASQSVQTYAQQATDSAKQAASTATEAAADTAKQASETAGEKPSDK